MPGVDKWQSGNSRLGIRSVYAQYLLVALGVIPFSWRRAFIVFLFIGRHVNYYLGYLLLFEKI